MIPAFESGSISRSDSQQGYPCSPASIAEVGVNASLAQISAHLLPVLFEDALNAILLISDTGHILDANAAARDLLGYTQVDLLGYRLADLVATTPSTDDFNSFWASFSVPGKARGELQLHQADGTVQLTQYAAIAHVVPQRHLIFLQKLPTCTALESHVSLLQDQMEQRVIERTATLQQQAERERLMMQIAQHIRQSLDLDSILQTTVTDVRELLQADRVLIYRFEADWSGIVVVESVLPAWTSVLGMVVRDPCFRDRYVEPYRQGRVQVMSNIHTAGLSDCHIDLLKTFEVQANLVVPILLNPELRGGNPDKKSSSAILWGLLIAHHCSAPRQWQAEEVQLLQQLATQAGIAIHQSELYRKLQRLNTNLEHQVQVRTAQFQQMLDFEARLKRITDKVRDSLDETQILQTAVQELVLGLGVLCCDTALYDREQATSTIVCDYSLSMPSARGKTVPMSGFPEVYEQLLRGEYVQFCPTFSSTIRPIWNQTVILACPIMDDHEVMGDLWLFKEYHEAFNELEVRLVHQVANQCAIALRQARLYHASQLQVTELARLNHLKDDFLSSMSHELRTPMASIKMAAQMLEIILQQAGVPTGEDNQAGRYLQILNDECQREINLITDVLDLTRLDAASDPLIMTPIALESWVLHVLEPLLERIQAQQLHLEIDIPKNLRILTDLGQLERIVTELIQNACKYTPETGWIWIAAQMVATPAPQPELGGASGSLAASPEAALPPVGQTLLFSVTNTGVEIPPGESDRVFDKFYRIPNSDPWKYSGTGLGLALVKRRVERLGGTIRVESGNGKTSFILSLPQPERK